MELQRAADSVALQPLAPAEVVLQLEYLPQPAELGCSSGCNFFSWYTGWRSGSDSDSGYSWLRLGRRNNLRFGLRISSEFRHRRFLRWSTFRNLLPHLVLVPRVDHVDQHLVAQIQKSVAQILIGYHLRFQSRSDLDQLRNIRSSQNVRSDRKNHIFFLNCSIVCSK